MGTLEICHKKRCFFHKTFCKRHFNVEKINFPKWQNSIFNDQYVVSKTFAKSEFTSAVLSTPEYNKLTAENVAARLAQGNLASKSDIANYVKKTDFTEKLKNLKKKVRSKKTEHWLIENEFKKLQTFDSSLFIG